ncbi:TPA: DUF2878 family protein [Legionella pneumophila subsp. pneumophila]|uniref:DUF2878 domain-containing protein n=1 Tax=Legionella pneumophila TaxID=446 RepID=UPI0001E3C58E|nr:DUF2878 domain-containing protein [Legionella pneumophila]MDC8030325.1 DUF2878 domain-containing protein [Legionella pneumophila subsp. pneumophila]MDW8870197.1 DUF2878 domain-containing protein [Legionella pneumophila]MDW8916226.1 DUF2878 domain-containing protein [Legionella pneumophila]MDW8925743.1 DUF2878 domain-containing protein [Legionella pneumophila]MDW8931861.1 DUF2878 domain-containing protein [Legionella pneumophila]
MIINPLHIVHYLSYYLCWIFCIYLASYGYPLLGLIITVLIMGLQIIVQILNQLPWRDALYFSIGLALLGAITDAIWLYSGMIYFKANFFGSHFPPLWMVALWLSFGFNLVVLYGSWLTFYFLWALVMFPSIIFAYWLGVQFGAATLIGSEVVFYLTLGLTWSLFLPLSLYLFNYRHRK